MEFDDVTPMVQNIIMMDSEGKRIAVKYYSDEWSTVSAQANFEKELFAKINRGQQRSLEGDVLLFDDVAVLYKRAGDLIIIVTGAQDENELILTAVLSGVSEALTILLRDVVNKKSVLENLDLVLITIDETVDQGIILEVDPQIIAQRVSMRPDSEGEGASAGYGEQPSHGERSIDLKLPGRADILSGSRKRSPSACKVALELSFIAKSAAIVPLTDLASLDTPFVTLPSRVGDRGSMGRARKFMLAFQCTRLG